MQASEVNLLGLNQIPLFSVVAVLGHSLTLGELKTNCLNQLLPISNSNVLSTGYLK